MKRPCSDQLQAQLTFNGSLFTLPWGNTIKAAIGGKYDWEDYDSTLVGR